jgi:hypothetical protein
LIAAIAFAGVMLAVYLWALGGDTTVSPPEPPPDALASAAAAEPVKQPRPPPRRSSRPTFTPSTTVYDDPPEPQADPDAVIVTGKVVDDRGRPVRHVSVKYRGDKGRRTTKSDERGHFSFRTTGDDVHVWAERRDGALVSQSQREVIAGSGEWEVVLELSSTKQAGLGIKVKKHAGGIYIRSILPGTPAAELELMAGDVIIAVDGEDVGGLPVRTVTQKLTGPVGTRQAFTVRHLDGSVQEYYFDRRSIAADRIRR